MKVILNNIDCHMINLTHNLGIYYYPEKMKSYGSMVIYSKRFNYDINRR